MVGMNGSDGGGDTMRGHLFVWYGGSGGDGYVQCK